MMMLKKIIFFPLAIFFNLISFFRNKLYDWGIIKSYSFNVPIVIVGNLAVGGTGKTPMVEFLIENFSKQYKIGVLSRGYKRKTSGFILASKIDNAKTIGDEPFQYFLKFSNIKVAVDVNRKRGIENLVSQGCNLILLDDAFQHRKIIPSYSVLLTEYNNLYCNDYLIPTGSLRESKYGSKRANCVIVTKCPKDLRDKEKIKIKKMLRLKKHQKLFFSSIIYPVYLFSKKSKNKISEFKEKDLNVVTGIANPSHFINFLKNEGLNFNHFKYPDHHNYTKTDIKKFTNKDVITTEKDFSKLIEYNIDNLYYLQIKTSLEKSGEFVESIKQIIN